MSENPVRRDDHGPIAVLTLDRAERRNALSRTLVDALADHLRAVETDPAVRVVVLTGAGPTFCAGMDLKEATEGAGADTPEAEGRAVAQTQAIADLIEQLHRLPKPTIAALQGDALAGGAGLAIACDFVVAADSARLGYPEIKRGLAAAIVMHDLVRQVGERRARQLLLGGEPIAAETAERWGLVNRVVPADRCRDEAMALARSLLACAPGAIATSKRLIDEATSRPADLRGPAAVSAAVRVADEAREGMRAFLEKRPPSWASGTPAAPSRDVGPTAGRRGEVAGELGPREP